MEQAFRRCGLNPAGVTSEQMDTARTSLFMLLMSLSSRGLNLWCIDEQYVEIVPGQAVYTLPAGSLDVLELHLAIPSYVEAGTVSWVHLEGDLGEYVLEGSADNVLYEPLQTLELTSASAWFKLARQHTYEFYRITGLGVVVASYAESVTDRPITAVNRTDYAHLPNKETLSEVPTSYWFEKLVEPRVTFWPTPSISRAFVKLIRYHQPHDIVAFTDVVEIPTRWWESITWHLALRLAFEMSGVSSERMAAVQQMASNMTFEADGRETDSAPVYFAPRIGVYT